MAQTLDFQPTTPPVQTFSSPTPITATDTFEPLRLDSSTIQTFTSSPPAPEGPPGYLADALYTCVTTDPIGTRGPGQLLEQMRISSQDRDEVVTQLVQRLSDMQTANLKAIINLFAALHDGRGCEGMKIRSLKDIPYQVWAEIPLRNAGCKETLEVFLKFGMPTSLGLKLVDAAKVLVDPEYLVDHFDVWFWAIRAGAADVTQMLVENGIGPGSQEMVRISHLPLR